MQCLLPTPMCYDPELSLPAAIGVEIIKYWLKINEYYDPAPDLHVLYWSQWSGDRLLVTDHDQIRQLCKGIQHRNRALIPEVVLQHIERRRESQSPWALQKRAQFPLQRVTQWVSQRSFADLFICYLIGLIVRTLQCILSLF